jgi:hypothetical protein
MGEEEGEYYSPKPANLSIGLIEGRLLLVP